MNKKSITIILAIIIFSILFLFGCEPPDNKIYITEVTFMNGTKDTINIIGQPILGSDGFSDRLYANSIKIVNKDVHYYSILQIQP
jgi:hypothetical protein